MPRKLRELRADMRRHGARITSQVSGHEKWKHPLLTLPTPKGGGCSGYVQPNGSRSRLTGLPGPTVGWSVYTTRLR